MLIPTHKIIRLLLIIELFLLIMNFFPADWCATFLPQRWCSSLETIFDLDQEANIPTWFSTLLLFSVAISSFIVHNLGWKIKNGTSWSYFWFGFGIVFCFLSLDEASGLHEMITSGLNIKWIWIYAPLGVLFFIICTYFLEYVNKNKALTNYIVGGLAIYALGILTSETFNFYFYLGKAESTIEEGFEMLGTIMVLTGCLKEMNRLFKISYDNKVKI